MDTPDESGARTFLVPAPPFEPPVESDCVQRARACSRHAPARPPLGGPDRRRRPFPRSLGPHLDSTAPGADPRQRFAGHQPGSTAERLLLAEARRGAEQAVKILLEVLDCRRPAEQMEALFAPSVVESVKTIVRTRPPGLRLGAATMRQVHITRSAPNAAEMFGTYTRGSRVFALAARLEHKQVARRPSWTVTSLRVV